MPKFQVLGKKDIFGMRSVRITYDGKQYHVSEVGDTMFYPVWANLRKPVDSETIREGVEGSCYTFATLGVSAVLTTTLDNKNYLILVEHKRRGQGFNDTVVKLLSGYIPANSEDLLEVVEGEITEEFLPQTRDGRFIQGMRGSRFLPRHFEGVEYDSTLVFRLVEGEEYRLHGVKESPVFFNDERVECSPRLFFHSPTSSAQIVFPFHIGTSSLATLADEPNYLRLSGVSLRHSEDEHIESERKLELVRVTTPIVLSEAFAKKDHGIAKVNNITLPEYLRTQR